MISDIWTIAWKDWKEALLARGTLRGGLLRMVLMVGVFGLMLPLQSKLAWVRSPISLVYWAWVPIFLVVGMVADAIAGERERHTLETLLSSRMPDQAILLGKVLASVLYGWGMAIVSLIVGLVAVNVAYGHGHFYFYPLSVVLAGGVLGFLVATLAASVGVLVSLRAPTVRQAAQTLSLVTMIIYFVPVGAITLLGKSLPASSLASVGLWLQGVNWTLALLAVGVVLALIDAAILAVARARFQRAKLILD